MFTYANMSELILAILALILSIVVIRLYFMFNNRDKQIKDIEITNILMDIEIKRRKSKDEIDTMPIDDLVRKRNSEE
jgi:hypothetical protein